MTDISIMNSEALLLLLQRKQWLKIVTVLKDNLLFDKLNSEPTFQIFRDHFINEILRDEANRNEDEFLILHQIFLLHKMDKAKFHLKQKEIEQLVIILIEHQPKVEYAKSFPTHPKCAEIIANHDNSTFTAINRTKNDAKVNEHLQVNQFGPKSDQNLSICVFKSPQEREFFEAANSLFSPKIVLPNAALSTVLSDKCIEDLSQSDRNFFFNTTVDFVVLGEDYYPEHFFELDSSFHDSVEQKAKDKLKEKLINDSGFELMRIRKRKSGDMTDIYKTLIQSKLKTKDTE